MAVDPEPTPAALWLGLLWQCLTSGSFWILWHRARTPMFQTSWIRFCWRYTFIIPQLPFLQASHPFWNWIQVPCYLWLRCSFFWQWLLGEICLLLPLAAPCFGVAGSLNSLPLWFPPLPHYLFPISIEQIRSGTLTTWFQITRTLLVAWNYTIFTNLPRTYINP